MVAPISRGSIKAPRLKARAPSLSFDLIFAIVVAMVVMVVVMVFRLNQLPNDRWNIVMLAAIAIIILRQLSIARARAGFRGVRSQ